MNVMKTQLSFRALLAGLCLTLLAACATHPPFGTSPLVGTWTNSIGSVWVIKSDGTFDVDLNHNGERDAWGTWSVTGDMVTLERTGGIKPKGCDGKGIYHFTRSGNTLQFTLASDKCKLRKKNVLLAWHRK
jgi:hypothetical protein